MPSPIPGEINLFFWVHPYDEQGVVRDVILVKTPAYWSAQMTVACVLKAPPLGFLAARTAENYENLVNLTPQRWRNLPPDETVEVPIRLDERKPREFPLA